MYYDHNMQNLQKYRHYFWELIQKQPLSEEDLAIRVESLSTRVQEKALLVEKDGVRLRLNSKYNPIEEARKWAEQFNPKNLDTIYTMFGFGNGIFIRELEKLLNKENRIIVFEPSLSIFLHVLHEYDLEDIIKNDKIMIIIQDINEYELPYLVSATLTWMNLFSKKECVHPGYDILFKQAYSDFYSILRDNVFNNVVAKNTYGAMGKPIVKNAMINLPQLKDSISIWDLSSKLPKDTTVIIASAGPSLSKNINELKKAKGHSIIIAVDRAYETFIAHGIEPDFVIVLDALKELKFCGNTKGFTIPLLCKYEASPDILENHNGKKIIYGFEGYASSIYRKVGKSYANIVSGGSVATAAFAIFATLGFHRIVLIGCDLAYDGDKSHSGSVSEEISVDIRELDLYVEDINGNNIKTRHDWYTFLRWFESVIIQMRESDVIDATEGGAKIKGARILTLREVVDQYCIVPINCTKILDEIEPSFKETDYNIIYEYLQDSKNDLKKIKKLANKAVKYCYSLSEQVERNMGLNILPEVMKNITEINSIIEEVPIYSMVNYYTLGEGTNSVGGLYFMTNNKELDDIALLDNMTNIYKITIEACDFMLPMLEEAILYYIKYLDR